MWQNDQLIYLTINGARLEGRCWGPPPDQADTIVLLHEGLGSVGLWRDFPEKLSRATGMGVFAFSRQGYGRSDLRAVTRAIDFMRVEAVDVLPHVLDAIGFRRGLFVGHSDGASIAAIYAGLVDDERLQGIVLMAPHFFIEEKTLASIREARDVFINTDLSEKMGRYHSDSAHTFFGWCDAWLRPEFASWDITDVLPGINIPVLAIHGADDQYGTVAQIDVIGDNIGPLLEKHILADCKHIPFLEQGEKVLGLIKTFARRVCG